MEKWKKPILHILKREKTEEMILMACKGVSLSGPMSGNNTCDYSIPDCNTCSSITAS